MEPFDTLLTAHVRPEPLLPQLTGVAVVGVVEATHISWSHRTTLVCLASSSACVAARRSIPYRTVEACGSNASRRELRQSSASPSSGSSCPLSSPQIGRESCRERVCKYV